MKGWNEIFTGIWGGCRTLVMLRATGNQQWLHRQELLPFDVTYLIMHYVHVNAHLFRGIFPKKKIHTWRILTKYNSGYKLNIMLKMKPENVNVCLCADLFDYRSVICKESKCRRNFKENWKN